MTLTYNGPVDVVFIQSDGTEIQTRFDAVLTETMAGLFDLSTPRQLPAAQSAESVCVTLNSGYSLGGAVTYADDFRLSFSRPSE